MTNIILTFTSATIFVLIINFILKKNKILLNFSGQNHQIYTKKKSIPLSGGLVIFLFLLINYNNFEIKTIFFFFLIFLVGLLADINIFKSPTKRFFIQILLIINFIIFLDLSINDVRIIYINNLLNNNYFNIFFTTFCLLILINGSNFIDGNNTLSLGYFGLIFFTLLSLENVVFTNIDENIIYSILVTIIVLYFFNIANKLYLGDNGVYLLSSITGYILIDFFKSNPSISPYFIVNLLWYPAFEIFFSFLRKLKSKYSPMRPDTFHLHQLIYFKISKRFSSNLVLPNSLTGNLINIYNGFIFLASSTNIYDTKMQLLILFINITIYTLLYLLFFKKWKTLNF